MTGNVNNDPWDAFSDQQLAALASLERAFKKCRKGVSIAHAGAIVDCGAWD